MDAISRNINGISIMVEPHSSNEIFFEEEFLQNNSILQNIFTPNELCKLIAGEKYLPLILTWELTDKCSFKCPFCYIVGHSNNKIVRFLDVKSELKKLINQGLLYCMLTGGEATLHPDFIEIYSFLKENGVIVEVYTNGSLINEQIIELFKKYPPYKVEISIYGVTDGNFRKVTNTENFKCDQILTTVKKLKEQKFNIICKTPLNTLTEYEFEHIQKWCTENGISHYYSTSVYNAYDGESMSFYETDIMSFIKYEAERINEIEDLCPNDFKPNSKSCYSCGIKNYGLHINSGFYLMPCTESHLEESRSNIIEVGIEKAIAKYRDFVEQFIDKDINGCSGCEASFHCKMCPARALPVRDSENKIYCFKVPENYCETHRLKHKKLIDKIMNN